MSHRRSLASRVSWLLTITAAIITACGAGELSDRAVSRPRPSETRVAAPDSRPTTSATNPTTSTTTVDAAIAEAIDVVPTYHSIGSKEIWINWVTTNKSNQAITAHQIEFTVRAEDEFGRVYSVELLIDCTKRVVAPSERVEVPFRWSSSGTSDLDQMEAAIDNCVLASWEPNPHRMNIRGLHEAVDAGAEATIVPNVNAIVFEDGSVLGDAE